MLRWSRREWLGSLAGMTCLGAGCARLPGNDLVIATSWSERECSDLAHAFRNWAAEGIGDVPALVWVRFEPWEPVARIAGRVSGWAVILGGPVSAYAPMVRAKDPRLGRWAIARRAPMGWAIAWKTIAALDLPEPRTWEDVEDWSWSGHVAIDDPRRSPEMLAMAKGRLQGDSWKDGYAGLVRLAGQARRVGRRRGQGIAELRRGASAVVPASAPQVEDWPSELEFLPIAEAPEWVEGAAIGPGAGPSEWANAFLQFLDEQHQGDRAMVEPGSDPPATDGLLADLLGATLVDAHDELRQAWAALRRTGQPARWERWLTEAPPWPPASVQRLLASDDRADWVETLVEQVALAPTVRSWLLQDWRLRQPWGPINGAVIHQLVTADEGRLVREPLVRSWLRAEWSAWARQRYRRVARQAAGGAPS